MASRTSRFVSAITVVIVLAGGRTLRAQTLEVTPFYGYRFGNDFFELVTAQPLDVDGAPAYGVVVDFPLSDGFQIEGLFSRQHGHIVVPPRGFSPAMSWNLNVDHWQGGGLQELGEAQRVRPFLTGTLGLTHFGSDVDSELRFTLAAGGGVKLFPSRHVGVRLDGRVFATFLDGHTDAGLCGSGGCILSLHLNVVWQADFTAGVVIRFY